MYAIRAITAERSKVAMVAVGVAELRQHVIRCGRAGFTGYATSDTMLAEDRVSGDVGGMGLFPLFPSYRRLRMFPEVPDEDDAIVSARDHSVSVPRES